jgi:hypothetical protein
MSVSEANLSPFVTANAVSLLTITPRLSRGDNLKTDNDVVQKALVSSECEDQSDGDSHGQKSGFWS